MRAGVTIYFIRHGETDWNAEARYQGQADIPMNATGRAQAQRNGEVLRGLLPAIARCRFIASPLSRARATMEIVRNAMGLAPQAYDLDDRLKEINYGAWQGVFAADLPAVDAEGLAARTKDTFHWRPRGGESYADLTARASSGWVRSRKIPSSPPMAGSAACCAATSTVSRRQRFPSCRCRRTASWCSAGTAWSGSRGADIAAAIDPARAYVCRRADYSRSRTLHRYSRMKP